ncbi:MAG: tetratricopeptide repeat protein [Ktedonobacteraceae bacterium]
MLLLCATCEKPWYPRKIAEQWYRERIALGNSGRFEKALETYEYAIQLNPKYVWAWFHKGKTLRELKRYDEALAL